MDGNGTRDLALNGLQIVAKYLLNKIGVILEPSRGFASDGDLLRPPRPKLAGSVAKRIKFQSVAFILCTKFERF